MNTDRGSFADLDRCIDAVAEAVHEAWCELKRADGWSPGPLDASRKTHPDLVAYVELSPTSQEYDRTTARTVVAWLAEQGFRIEPPIDH